MSKDNPHLDYSKINPNNPLQVPDVDDPTLIWDLSGTVVYGGSSLGPPGPDVTETPLPESVTIIKTGSFERGS